MDGVQITALGALATAVFAGIVSLFTYIDKRRSGLAAEERQNNLDKYNRQRDAEGYAAEQQERADRFQHKADVEIRNRNRWADYAAELRRIAIAHGADSVPDSPRNEKP